MPPKVRRIEWLEKEKGHGVLVSLKNISTCFTSS